MFYDKNLSKQLGGNILPQSTAPPHLPCMVILTADVDLYENDYLV